MDEETVRRIVREELTKLLASPSDELAAALTRAVHRELMRPAQRSQEESLLR
jgi:hypothetical protein